MQQKTHTNDDASDINREIRVDTSASELKFQLKTFTTKKKSIDKVIYAPLGIFRIIKKRKVNEEN